jgi:electron transfer flavoprotein alpha subunit
MKKVWIYAELSGGRLQPITLELLAAARELGEVEVIALGAGATSASAVLGEHGAGRIYASDDSVFDEYLAEPATDTLAMLVEQHHPELIIFGFTNDSREVAGRLSARLGVGQVSNAVNIAATSTGFCATVPYFGATKLVKFELRNNPAIVLIRPKSFQASATGGTGEIVSVKPVDSAQSRRARIVETKTEQSERVRLEDAAVVVSGGRGLQAAENFKLVEDLADTLNAAVGASRAIVDAGWVPYSFQVGQTGKSVSPKLYIACGISGAMQHWVGMKGSKLILAINKDPDAPLMKVADLAVVGDAVKILPKLTAALRAR